MTMNTTMNIHRIMQPKGHVEFRDASAAAAYRDEHHPGASIVVIERTITEAEDGTRTETDEVIG